MTSGGGEASRDGPGDGPGELPPLADATLDLERLEALFEDLRALAEIDRIVVKDRPGHVTHRAAVTLEEAERLVREGAVRGVQIRYRHDGAEWWDTLMPVSGGARLVRIRHEAGPSG